MSMHRQLSVPSPKTYRALEVHHAVEEVSTAEHRTLFQAAQQAQVVRKGLHSIRVESKAGESTDELQDNEATSHSRNWSASTDTTTTSETTSLNHKKRAARFSISGSWTFELAMLAVGVTAVASIVGVIASFNGRALPDWPYYITLNALIALLATIANATISVSLSSGISQAKWIRFNTAKVPLSDIEAFDDASRGLLGAVKLLISGRGGDVGATIPRALNYTGALPGNTSSTGFVPILPLKAAVYNGLFAENSRPAASLPFQCQSGNCAWDTFETLGVCHECMDLSSLMTRYCAPNTAPAQNSSICGWRLPQGARLNSSADAFSRTSYIPSAYGDMPHSTIIRIIFMGTEAQDTPDVLNPWAKQCTLQACVNTLSSTVINGTIAENITSSALNNTVVDMSSPSKDTDYGVYITGPSSSTYVLGMGALLSMRGWFSTIFTNGSATRSTSNFSRSIPDPERAVVVNLTVGISSGETFFDTDISTAFYWNYYEYADGLDMLMGDLAVSMTTAFRGFAGAVPVNGNSITSESYVHVRWGFAVVPVAVVALTLAFLFTTMTLTRTSKTSIWKSNAMVPLFHGLDQETREVFTLREGLQQKKAHAKKVKVSLALNEENELLLRGEKSRYEGKPVTYA